MTSIIRHTLKTQPWQQLANLLDAKYADMFNNEPIGFRAGQP